MNLNCDKTWTQIVTKLKSFEIGWYPVHPVVGPDNSRWSDDWAKLLATYKSLVENMTVP